jgi:hypothetical protein
MGESRIIKLKRAGLRRHGTNWTLNGHVQIAASAIAGTADNTWAGKLRRWRQHKHW